MVRNRGQDNLKDERRQNEGDNKQVNKLPNRDFNEDRQDETRKTGKTGKGRKGDLGKNTQ